MYSPVVLYSIVVNPLKENIRILRFNNKYGDPLWG